MEACINRLSEAYKFEEFTDVSCYERLAVSHDISWLMHSRPFHTRTMPWCVSLRIWSMQCVQFAFDSEFSKRHEFRFRTLGAQSDGSWSTHFITVSSIFVPHGTLIRNQRAAHGFHSLSSFKRQVKAIRNCLHSFTSLQSADTLLLDLPDCSCVIHSMDSIELHSKF